ncbi:unnamed protein product [Alternaria alternata]
MRSLKNTWASPCKPPQRPEWERKLEPLSWLDWFEKFFPTTCRVDKFSASWQNSLELIFKSHNDGYIESQEYGYGFKVKGSGYGFNMRFILEVVEDSNGNLVEYTPSSSTDSPQSWDLIRRWLSQCTQDHGRCNLASPQPWAPTRLLDVGTFEDDLVRLLDRAETLPLSNKPYATLSHCWGTTPLIRTTQSNILEHRREIRHHYLPPTFKDAIKIARTLSIRYLWIDSLCIIQDDTHDWEQEADLMSKVYMYSFISIAATASDSSTGGCFRQRDGRTVLPTEVYIQMHDSGRDNDEKPAKVKYRLVLHKDLWTEKLADEPLNQRCWILQERILSPRVLHFGHEQLFWECREFVACETYHQGLPASLRNHPYINIKRLQLGDEPKDDRWPAKYVSKASQDISNVQSLWDKFTSIFRPIVIHETTLYAGLNNTSVYQDWYSVVEFYSMGNLTFPNDKLIALSGIAQTIVSAESSKLGDGYLAGLWQSSLPASLLWQPIYTYVSKMIRTLHFIKRLKTHCNCLWRRYPDTCPPLEREPSYCGVCESNKTVHPARRYVDYIAPTWSWASIDGRVSFAACRVNYRSEDYLTTVEDASVSCHGNYRFGRISSGFVKLSGPVASVSWLISHYADSKPRPSYGEPMTIKGIFPPHLAYHTAIDTYDINGYNKEEIILDIPMEDIPRELTLLCVVETKESNGHTNLVRGLVIQRSSLSEHYVRIGVFVVRREEVRKVLVNMPSRSITII